MDKTEVLLQEMDKAEEGYAVEGVANQTMEKGKA
jgi:hypothetical protein